MQCYREVIVSVYLGLFRSLGGCIYWVSNWGTTAKMAHALLALQTSVDGETSSYVMLL